MFKEFKEFAAKGNMLDMAVGIVIGAAFGTVIKSLVDDVVMPIVSSIFGTPDFSNLFVILKEPAEIDLHATVRYLNLLDEQSALKSKVKEADAALDKLAYRHPTA